jgi:hypothetical protein
MNRENDARQCAIQQCKLTCGTDTVPLKERQLVKETPFDAKNVVTTSRKGEWFGVSDPGRGGYDVGYKGVRFKGQVTCFVRDQNWKQGYHLPSWLRWSSCFRWRDCGSLTNSWILNQSPKSIPQSPNVRRVGTLRTDRCRLVRKRRSLEIRQSRCSRSPIGTPCLAEGVGAIWSSQ